MAPQQIEKIEFAPGNGRGSEAADPQDVVNGRAATLRDSARMTKLQKLQKKAPKVLKSLDAKLKSAPVAAGNAGELVGEDSSARLGAADRRPSALSGARKKLIGRTKRRETFPGRKPLKSHERRKESRFAPATAPESPALRASPPRRSAQPASPPAPSPPARPGRRAG
jgi:hypothetical protein